MTVVRIPQYAIGLSKPQFHSRKHHHTYNGASDLPITSSVRPAILLDPTCGDRMPVFEIALFYRHNRACTIYRSWEDFQRLQKTLLAWKNAPVFRSPRDVHAMHIFLREAIAKRPKECALEYFLRRRMEDCAGC